MRRLRARLVTSLPGGSEVSAGPKNAANEPRLRKLVWVERRKASALIARRAHAFARRAADRSQDPPRAPRKRLASPGAPFPLGERQLGNGRTNLGFTRDWLSVFARSAKADLAAPAKEYGARSYARIARRAQSACDARTLASSAGGTPPERRRPRSGSRRA
jgi:hypothetical protein